MSRKVRSLIAMAGTLCALATIASPAMASASSSGCYATAKPAFTLYLTTPLLPQPITKETLQVHLGQQVTISWVLSNNTTCNATAVLTASPVDNGTVSLFSGTLFAENSANGSLATTVTGQSKMVLTAVITKYNGEHVTKRDVVTFDYFSS